MDNQEIPGSSSAARDSRSRVFANRALFVAALLAIVLGVALGQAFITWFNATLL